MNHFNNYETMAVPLPQRLMASKSQLSTHQSAAAAVAAAPPPQQFGPNQTEIEEKILQITQFNIQTYMTTPGTYYFRKLTNTTALLYVIIFMTNDTKIGGYKFTFTNDKIQMEPLERYKPSNYKYKTHNNIDELLTFVQTKNNIDKMKYIIDVKEESQAADATPKNVQPSAPPEIDIRINDAIKFMEQLQHGTTNQTNSNLVGVFNKEDAKIANDSISEADSGFIYYYFTYEKAGPVQQFVSSLRSKSKYAKKYSWRLIIVDYRNKNRIIKNEIEITPCEINGEFCMCIKKDAKYIPRDFIKLLSPNDKKNIPDMPVADFIKNLKPTGIIIQLKGGKAKKTRARRSKKSKRNPRRNTKRHRK